MYPEDLRYTKEHEWVRLENGRARVGITYYAQDELGDVVFVDLPRVGTNVQAGEAFAAVESVKAVSDVYAPVSGRIVEVNEELADRPELINEDPYGRGWIAVIEMDNPAEADELLDAAQYKALIEE
ncbi:MAG: glycine cleavage system protein GcvH [Limnochordales bacterium]|nr:glycine cleavage system protein H [Bacillota bacterium]REJ31794.1 MAG: glycine cleavage system protein GcvH [Bacillota bacterium]